MPNVMPSNLPDTNPDTNSDTTPDVVILGGGIAGIAAALESLDAGRRVTLVETRAFLGGRAFSFTDRETGLELDNGQHVFVGCCTAFIDFLERLGAPERWFRQDRLNLPVLDRAGRAGALSASRLPAPLHLLPSFLAYPHLSATDKLRALAGMLRARFTNRHDLRLEDLTFYQWLRQRGQSERAIANLWNLVVEPTLNDNVRQVSAAMGLMIVQDGMLAGTDSANLGYARQGLLPALGEPARKLLADKGARLLLGSPVRRLRYESRPGSAPGRVSNSESGPLPVEQPAAGRITGAELATGQWVAGRQFISALPFSALTRLLLPALPPELAARDYFGNIGQLQWSPIVNLHILYDRPVLDAPFYALVDSPLQWVFNHSLIAGADPAGGRQLVTVSVSAAWRLVDLPREQLAREFVAEMARVFPAAGAAQVRRVNVVKQREATFRCLPGANRLRPGPVSPIPNLFLAGEWTNTGWPSTMEGAVRSGYAAARAAGSAGQDAI